MLKTNLEINDVLRHAYQTTSKEARLDAEALALGRELHFHAESMLEVENTGEPITPEMVKDCASKLYTKVFESSKAIKEFREGCIGGSVVALFIFVILAGASQSKGYGWAHTGASIAAFCAGVSAVINWVMWCSADAMWERILRWGGLSYRTQPLLRHGPEGSVTTREL